MKAIVKFGNRPEDIEYKDVPDPKPEFGKVLIRMKNTAICYTDISIVNGKYKGRKPLPIPMIPGHEGAGIVEESFSGSLFRAGDRVSFEPVSGCRICNNCLTGNVNMCTNWDHIGITCDGTFAEYVVVPERSIHKLPDEVEFVEAAALEPIGLAARSIEYVKPVLGDVAAVVGPGAIGLLHVQALKASGCRVIVIGIDKDAFKFQVAEKLGADLIVNISKENASEAVAEYTHGLGVDIAIETASSPLALNTVFDVIGAKGRVALFGLYPEANIRILDIVRKGVSIYGDAGILGRHFSKAVKWLQNGYVRAKPITTGVYPLQDGVQVIQKQESGETIKTIFEM